MTANRANQIGCYLLIAAIFALGLVGLLGDILYPSKMFYSPYSNQGR